ncbi:pancreatic lipase-related protein 2-like [Littorina saxatilis]|uniref:pancreatic lipase-related protein 2-like n=1 Tax=Littorina saxatilis TaxID=31220 RepID=UPI0038B44FF8
MESKPKTASSPSTPEQPSKVTKTDVIEVDDFDVDSENPFNAPSCGSDVALVVEDKKLYVHKCVLSLHSPVFRAMFTSNFSEKDASEVPLPTKKYDAVLNFLLHLYPVYSLKNIAAWWLSKKCYNEMLPEYRCYDLKSPYTNTLLHYPKSPTDQNIHFKLFTNSNPTSAQILGAQDKNSVTSSNFNANGKVAFLIHGFTDSSDGEWVGPLVAELLTQVPNVIVVDWAEGAKGPNYAQAAANTRVVGAQIATLIKTLAAVGLNKANVHLIGHSLGAQIAGYAGEKFPTDKVGRISGLDPAAPLFENSDIRVKLDPSDAAFVDVMHTDGEPLHEGGLGTVKITGHVDFFPNGGKDQPGCPKRIGLNLAKIADNIGCSHLKAPLFFRASINDNEFLANPCANLDDYEAGQCTSCGSGGCNKMGYHATESPSGLFVLDTGEDYPF